MNGVWRPRIRRPALAHILLCGGVIVLLGVAGCENKQLTRMEQNQIRLQAMVAANARQLATVSSQVYVGDTEVQEKLLSLDQNDRNLGLGVTTVQNEQARLHETVTTGNTTLNKRMTTLDGNQRALLDGVTQVAGVTQRTAADVTAIAREQATLHEMVQAGRQELAGSIAAVASNQQETRTDIAKLHETDQGIVQQLTVFAADQDTMRQTLDSNHRIVTGQVAALGQNQQALQADVGQLHQKADQATGRIDTLATGQKEIQNIVKGNGETMVAKFAGLDRNQAKLGADLAGLNTKADTISSDIGTISSGQAAVRDMISAHQETTAAALAALSGKADTISNDIGTVSAGQTALRDTISANHETTATALAALSEKQTSLVSAAGSIDAKADALAAGQNAIQGTIRDNGETAAAKVTALAENQAKLDADLAGLGRKADTIASGVGTVAATQTALQDLISTNHQTTASALATLAEKQTQLVANTDAIGAKTDAITGNIKAAVDRQAALEQNVKAGNDALAARDATIRDNQQAMKTALETLTRDAQQAPARQQAIQDQLDILTATLGQTALDVIGLKDNQDLLQQAMQVSLGDIRTKTAELSGSIAPLAKSQESLNQALRDHADAVSRQVTTLASRQTDMQSSVDSILATAAQTDLDVLGVSTRQDALAQGLRSHSEAVTGRIADVAQSQQQMASGVDTLVATAGQSALDILALSDGQAKLQQAARTDRTELAARLEQISQSQQQTESGVDTLVATAGQSALDILALSDGQAKLQQSAQAERTELAAKLAEIVQGQQQWTQRFDAAQNSMKTIAASTASLEQQVARLQAAIQTNVEGLTAAMQSGVQDRRQVETKVNQDIQAMIEALSQIRQAHALLGEQMQQMQGKTQGQTADIISAIERLKQPAPELKVSDSSVRPVSSMAAATARSDSPAAPATEVTVNDPNQKLESSVAEAAAK